MGNAPTAPGPLHQAPPPQRLTPAQQQALIAQQHHQARQRQQQQQQHESTHSGQSPSFMTNHPISPAQQGQPGQRQQEPPPLHAHLPDRCHDESFHEDDARHGHCDPAEGGTEKHFTSQDQRHREQGERYSAIINDHDEWFPSESEEERGHQDDDDGEFARLLAKKIFDNCTVQGVTMHHWKIPFVCVFDPKTAEPTLLMGTPLNERTGLPVQCKYDGVGQTIWPLKYVLQQVQRLEGDAIYVTRVQRGPYEVYGNDAFGSSGIPLQIRVDNIWDSRDDTLTVEALPQLESAMGHRHPRVAPKGEEGGPSDDEEALPMESPRERYVKCRESSNGESQPMLQEQDAPVSVDESPTDMTPEREKEDDEDEEKDEEKEEEEDTENVPDSHVDMSSDSEAPYTEAWFTDEENKHNQLCNWMKHRLASITLFHHCREEGHAFRDRHFDIACRVGAMPNLSWRALHSVYPDMATGAPSPGESTAAEQEKLIAYLLACRHGIMSLPTVQVGTSMKIDMHDPKMYLILRYGLVPPFAQELRYDSPINHCPTDACQDTRLTTTNTSIRFDNAYGKALVTVLRELIYQRFRPINPDTFCISVKWRDDFMGSKHVQMSDQRALCVRFVIGLSFVHVEPVSGVMMPEIDLKIR